MANHPQSRKLRLIRVLDAETREVVFDSITSGEAAKKLNFSQPFYNNEKGSNERHSKRDACITDSTPHNETNQMSQTLS